MKNYLDEIIIDRPVPPLPKVRKIQKIKPKPHKKPNDKGKTKKKTLVDILA